MIYLLALAVDLFAAYTGSETIRYVSKPLLMPLLTGLFIFSTKGSFSGLKKWVILALAFSWLGDVLLMFESTNSNYFIFGLIAFLIAHVFYIVLFDQVRVKENFKQSLVPLLPIAVYYILLISLLQPHLGAMQKPVRIYGLIISIMLSFAADLWRLKDKQASLFIISGALLFVASDSLLAINKFYEQFEYAGIAVMLTYGIAQLLITLGAARYISSSSTHKFAE
ncbi:MAG TPA: lysoplasmalogenase [Chitinophagaceae bacterium]|nr:lysoplasmalogenase [Chitinophagaceae bacterium]